MSCYFLSLIFLFKMYVEIDSHQKIRRNTGGGGGWALGYFLGRYEPPGTTNWNPVLKKISR